MTGPAPYTAHDIEAIIAILVTVTAVASVLMKRATRPRRTVARTSRRGKIRVKIESYDPADVEYANMRRRVPVNAARHRDIRTRGMRLK